MHKRNLNKNDNYIFLYNAKRLSNYNKTLEEIHYDRNSSINVVSPGIIGVK